MQPIQFYLNLTNTSLVFFNLSLSQFFSFIHVSLFHCPSVSPNKINKTQYLNNFCQCNYIYKTFWQLFFFLGFFQNNYIFYCNCIDMLYVMVSNLQLILFFVCSILESFKKILMRCLTMSSIIVYYTTIILIILNKVVNYIKLKVVKDYVI